MKVNRIIAVAILAFAPTILSSQSSQPRDTSWQWQGNCPQNKRMQILLLLDGKAIFHSDFAFCQIRKALKASTSQQKNLVFSFKGGHVFQKDYLTSPNQMIEGNIWLAGSEPDAMLLGVSFTNDKKILLNTIHVAKPDGVSSTEIDQGVVVRTLPLNQK